jgi:hypothetical protein
MTRTPIVAGALSLVTLTLMTSSQADDTARINQSLAIIENFAASLCGSVEAKGKTQAWDASVAAKAGLSGVVKQVADLGASAATKYTQSSYEGVLQSDIGKIIENEQDCRFKVFDALKNKLIPDAPPAPIPDSGSDGGPGNTSIYTAASLISGGFGNSLQYLENKGINATIHKDESDNSMFINYDQSIFGQQFSVGQSIDSAGKTGKARAWKTLANWSQYLSSGVRSSGPADSDITNMCSQNNMNHYLSLLARKYGIPLDVKDMTTQQNHSETADFTESKDTIIGGASWSFRDKTKIILYVHGIKTQRVYKTSTAETEGHSCSIELCALPAGEGTVCFNVEGLSV